MQAQAVWNPFVKQLLDLADHVSAFPSQVSMVYFVFSCFTIDVSVVP